MATYYLKGERLRLFCFPYAGGGASSFRAWQERLPPAVEVYAVNPPGRGGRFREPPLTDMPSLVEALTKELLPQFDQPFAFFGHSLGALVCFELARLLRRRYAPEPVGLFVSGHGAPQLPDPEPPIHNLPEQEFIDELRRLNGTPEGVLDNNELRELMLPILRADFTVAETYVYRDEPPLDSPIQAFGGLLDHKAGRERLEAWREQTTGAFALRMLPGGHFFIHTAQDLLLQILSGELSRLHQLTRR